MEAELLVEATGAAPLGEGQRQISGLYYQGQLTHTCGVGWEEWGWGMRSEQVGPLPWGMGTALLL